MTEYKQTHTAPAKEIQEVGVEDEMEESYIDYAMSVIVGRSIPDVRDGMKPVQRRILYSMDEQGLYPTKSHRKSANVVGETMGEYHPHGDSAIYDALARMSQDFSLRYPLIDGQGNFGSIDGDPPAAMRYTEARLAPLAEELLEDIDKDTVDFSPNYDDRTEEPDVLPAKFPSLLVNGASGIAVGLSTKIPSHNLGEIIDATIHLINNPDCETKQLMEHVPGPDFPMGGKIVGRDGIYDAYESGRGRITVRAKYEINYNPSGKDTIIINEIPPETNKERIIKKIADLAETETIEGITGLRDESNREDGVRIVIEVKPSAVTEVVENQLKDKILENTYGIINLSIVDGEPEVLSLKETLKEWIKHRKQVVKRRSEQELEEKEDRIHILEGRMKALENTDSVVELIRSSEDRTEARQELRSKHGFSEEQSKHIVRMQLGSLTSMEEGEVQEEYEKLEKRVERLKEIIESERELLNVIKEELQEVKNQYDDERRTEIVESSEDVTREDLIPEEDIVIPVSRDGYIKRMSRGQFSPQNRGGKGVIGINLKQGDTIKEVYSASTHDTLLVFTNKGKVHKIKGYDLPEYGRTARGEPSITIFDSFEDDESITEITPLEEIKRLESLVLVTRKGLVNRTSMKEFTNIFSTGIHAIELQENDEVVSGFTVESEPDIMIHTRDGRAIRFSLSEVSETGRGSKGVNAIKLGGSEVVSAVPVGSKEDDVLTLTENGFGKRTASSNYRTQSRYGKGVIDIKTGDRNGLLISSLHVREGDEIILMTRSGKIMRTSVDKISRVSRNSKGVKIIELADGDFLSAALVV